MPWRDGISPDEEPLKVLLKRGDFIDESRAGRIVPFKIYYPVDHGLEKMPVVIWSHGFGGNRDGAGFISRFIASHGYTIIHLTHHGTDSSLWEGKPGHPWDILRKIKISREAALERFKDVPFALDQLQRWTAENPEVGRYMDLSNLGMSGHSFGAMTTQVMAGMKFPDLNNNLIQMKDERFKAGILYSPVPIPHLSDAPPQDLYTAIDLPLLHMTGTEDDSPLEGFGYRERLLVHEHSDHPEKYLQLLEGGDHMVYNGTRGKLAVNPLREQHENEIKLAALAFWDSYLKDDERAEAWLKAHYQAA